MRILILSQYFFPESFIINNIVAKLIEQGHQVTVATGKPNYPDGQIFRGYTANGTQRETYLDTVEVVRVPLWPRGRGGAKNLILNYFSFAFAGLMLFPWLLRKRAFDAILVFAPSPITQAIPAVLLKWLKGAKLVLWIQDLWPESLAATGFIKNRYVLKAVGWMVRGIYGCCDLLLVQSRGFINPVTRYAARQKIVYHPNSFDSRPFPAASIPETLNELFANYFCVVFAGNLGTAQSLDTLVQAAVELRNEPSIRLILIGSGSRLEWLEQQRLLHQLENLILPGRFPMDAMSPIFERASALLVSLNDEAIFAQTVPSKIQAYLAAGRPIIASINGEGARVVLEAGAGLTSPAEHVESLVANIRRLKEMTTTERTAMGESGRAYFEEHFDMSRQVANLVELLGRDPKKKAV
ncbi:glycosyltransferase family 4 protein [Pseudomonas sp. TH05]|uniref:glycosyltransferase family 4 protein n=1 Tax=unclassified Pseudomonas TaxID=196821 RepID=UPI001913820E|nr:MULTISPECIES: glycosyltransferase family 4 protein [unclassified Pseudomonas]MBK5537025.1 glycosyltransferase family 4 protein [Pseudomonas sp. TH07]MBK5559898.1 glycosyltransferase family 4 protein [Pseudomonas sp. TH05]